MYNSDSKSCEIGHEHNQEIISLMKEYSQDVLLGLVICNTVSIQIKKWLIW